MTIMKSAKGQRALEVEMIGMKCVLPKEDFIFSNGAVPEGLPPL
jgi:hypothetical protein